jgi:2-oxoisovalerate dehydrogenase E1 component
VHLAEVPLPEGAEPMRMSRAISAELRRELTDDPRAFLAGIDVGAGGDVFGLTRKLGADFPGGS